MNQDIFIDRQRLTLENGQEISLHYFITQQRVENQECIYGIRVLKRGESYDEENTGPISKSKEYVSNLCRLIAGYQVTPLGLINIVDDYMTQQ